MWDPNQTLFLNRVSYKSDGYIEHWNSLLSSFQLNAKGCNTIDIGANDGKSLPVNKAFSLLKNF